MTTEERWFPYTSPSWLNTLVDLFRRAVPGRIDVDWLRTPGRLELNPPNARQFLSLLQRLGWIAEDGSVTAEGEKLRLVGPPYEAFMNDIVERYYGDLVAQIMQAEDYEPQELDRYFVAASRLGKSGRGQMIRTFRWFVEQAGLTGVEQRVWPGRAPQPTVRRRADGGERREGVRGTPPPATPGAPRRRRGATAREVPVDDQRMSAIASVLRINIDHNWTDERIKKVFLMLDGLLRGEPHGG